MLRELGFLPGTAMVIRGDELVPESGMLEADDVVGGTIGDLRWCRRMKCTRCKAPAAVELRQHNAGFCRACFIFYFQRQVQRAVEKEHMFAHEEAVLVAVSGGKDSLALWDVLIELGYQTTGLHLSLGIGAYSDQSTGQDASRSRMPAICR